MKCLGFFHQVRFLLDASHTFKCESKFFFCLLFKRYRFETGVRSHLQQRIVPGKVGGERVPLPGTASLRKGGFQSWRGLRRPPRARLRWVRPPRAVPPREKRVRSQRCRGVNADVRSDVPEAGVGERSGRRVEGALYQHAMCGRDPCTRGVFFGSLLAFAVFKTFSGFDLFLVTGEG